VDKRIQELLPFYVNGSLGDAERAEVEAMLATDPDIRAEVEFLSRLRSEVKDVDLESSPGELGLARVLRTIETPAPRWQTGRLAASFVAGLSIAGILAYMTGSQDAGEFVQASQGAGATTLTIAFQPLAQEAQISKLLIENGLEIVSGPSALGIYKVATIDGKAPGSAIAALRRATDIIESVGDAE